MQQQQRRATGAARSDSKQVEAASWRRKSLLELVIHLRHQVWQQKWPDSF